MRHTLRELHSGAWAWTYSRDIFFFAGVSPSRRTAIRRLLEARSEAREVVQAMQAWLASVPKQRRAA